MAPGTKTHTQEVIAINTFGLEERTRTSLKSGKTQKRYTVTIKSEPVLGVFDDRVLGEGPANAIRDIMAKQINAISERASEHTIAFRERAKTALSEGRPWAVKRYTEMRAGDKDTGKRAFTPGVSDRLFNDSGLFASKLAVRENKTEQSWTVNVPGNRFDDRTWIGDEAKIQAMILRLQQLVPEVGNPLALTRHREFGDALQRAIDNTITRADRRTRWGAMTELGRAYAGLGRQLAALGRGVVL